jgi:hypothetical protein
VLFFVFAQWRIVPIVPLLSWFVNGKISFWLIFSDVDKEAYVWVYFFAVAPK